MLDASEFLFIEMMFPIFPILNPLSWRKKTNNSKSQGVGNLGDACRNLRTRQLLTSVSFNGQYGTVQQQVKLLQSGRGQFGGLYTNLSYRMLELQCEQKFSMGSTYDYGKEIEATLLDSIPAWVRAKCAARKIIRSISNLIKINPLECCLLAWLLAKSKFDIDRISADSTNKLVEEEFDQKVLLFILMNGYYVKEFLCQHLQPEIEQDIATQIPNFRHLYSKKFNPEKSLKTLSLADINKIFNEWTCRESKRNKMDYNNLVDKILYLSKSYNVTAHDQNKQEKLGVPRKRRKINPSNPDDNDIKSYIETPNESKSQSGQHCGKEKKFPPFRFSNSPEHDFMGPSQDQPHSYNKREQMLEMAHSKRTTRNMLQSINIYDYIPSQDNLFHSQMSSMSMNNLMSSQQSVKNSMVDSNVNVRNNRSSKNAMKIKKTQSYDQIK